MTPFAPFHEIHGADLHDQVQQKGRLFEGDGTPWLKVPGCRSVEHVSLPNLPLPPEIEYEVPIDHTLTRLQRVVEPLYKLAHQADGTPVLLRHLRSNDGVWQKGMSVRVVGEWADDETTAATPPETAAGEAQPQKGRK